MLVQVKGYPKYQVSDQGYVVGARGNVLLVDKNSTGYSRVTLCRDGIPSRVFVHRLVAEHFVPVVEGNPILNHIDGDKDNNTSTNLEWTTHEKNLKHALDTGLRDMKRKVEMTPEQKQLCIKLIQSGVCYREIAATVGVTYNAVACTKHRMSKEGATTIPKGSTSQANGDGSA